ncbi:ABC transporter ATP-binding protein [Gloeocapsopsis sp. IPPAS B-1203]|uniref:ABC transporter ATP-binding protein n=1 Tax=Gloeocapsopsis sp. IPPAS B-1203 TaxID=2049454 RepID=UPI000C19A8CA|nr:ABC transporter ATP-binding protein [Gloeocapsopsis sp. IPPAS B-1203]PIG95215.1 cobalamin/Fe(3+)-siderophore ABC transporter ATP-binding protein [Gloeocapsopsis sp. IPPAS B-1203]
MTLKASSPNRLSTQRLTLAYDKAAIIKNLDLAIPKGKMTALVGANGCGKSTLLRGLARLLKPRSGAVYLDAKDVFKLSTKQVAKQLGILSQSPVAPEGLTVKDLVACGRYPYQSWLQQWSPEDERLVELALATTAMTEFAERELDTLSGGQRQRAWIAMALAQDTEILLLDEPTTFLDLAHQIEVLDLLQELNHLQGRTLVMVLHDLNQACRYVDYLVALKQGGIYAHGTPQEVMTEEVVREVFGLDSRIIADPVAGTPMCIPLSRKVRSAIA